MFRAHQDFAFYKDCLQLACERHDCELHAYVLMTNHVHLLLTANSYGAVAKCMQSVGVRYARYMSRVYGRSGTMLEGRYWAGVVDTDRYLLNCHRYIDLNPSNAMMVLDPAHYEWSSYRANALGVADPLVTPHPTFLSLGTDEASARAAYQQLCRIPLSENDLRELRVGSIRGRELREDGKRPAA